MAGERRYNWARNHAYSAGILRHPRTVEEVQELVSRSARLKALGSGHSFNDIADTGGEQISLARLERRVEIDRSRAEVTVDGGARYGDICGRLHQAGFALPNLASLPHIVVAGACATATHGSGVQNRLLADSVSALEIVCADGRLLKLSRKRDSEAFPGAAVSLGALGIITSITLDLVPTFEVSQKVYERLSFRQVEEHFESILSAAYSVSLFTTWKEEVFDQVWVKRRVGDATRSEPDFEALGASPAAGAVHPIAELSPDSCTLQLGQSGPWHERIPHFRMDFRPSHGDELQSEYLVPRESARAAIRAIASLRDQIVPLLLVSEVRTVASDDLWMSCCYETDCAAFHFTWRQDWPAVSRLLPELEAALKPFRARPHWGKLFTMDPASVRSLYPRLENFRELASELDPDGKFRNEFLNRCIFGGAHSAG